VLFSKPGRRVAILLQDLANGGLVRPDDGVVTGIAGGHLSDHAETNRVMVATSDQGSSRG